MERFHKVEIRDNADGSILAISINEKMSENLFYIITLKGKATLLTWEKFIRGRRGRK
jgi:hypothetical protein